MWKQITTIIGSFLSLGGCVQRTSGLNVKANHNRFWFSWLRLRLCSKNVRIKCESKSQPVRVHEWNSIGCVQRTSGLNVKANHNHSCAVRSAVLLCSKNVRIKCESKSQQIYHTCLRASSCVQRTSGLNVKANHNHTAQPRPLAQVVFKERPD